MEDFDKEIDKFQEFEYRKANGLFVLQIRAKI